MPKAVCRASPAWCKPLGDARPAWKVLRVLGNLLGLPGFAETSEEVRAEALGDLATLARAGQRTQRGRHVLGRHRRPGLERVADVPIYAADAGAPRGPVAATDRRRT
jgi:NADH-quinone oxidoreductase subunit G